MTDWSQEVFIVPVDSNGRAVLFSELKIEDVDKNYRRVRDSKGLAYRLPPGEYRIKVFLPTLRMKSMILTITAGVATYKICVEERDYVEAASPVQDLAPAPRREAQQADHRAPRFSLSFPVAYRQDDGEWINTTALNVSTTGVCLINLRSSILEGNVYVRLYVPILSVPLECPARVCWFKQLGVYPPQMGLELYLTPNMRSSLDNWLSREQ